MKTFRKKYAEGHVVEDLIADDRETLTHWREHARGNSFFDPSLSMGYLAPTDLTDTADPPWDVLRSVRRMRHARLSKDFAIADKIRAELAERGFEIQLEADGGIAWLRIHYPRCT